MLVNWSVKSARRRTLGHADASAALVQPTTGLAPKIVNLNTIIRDTESMLRRAIGEDVELETVLAEYLGSVRADPGQVEQVLLNLVVNAHDAMPQGGTLTIETANVQVDGDDAATHPGIPSGPYCGWR